VRRGDLRRLADEPRHRLRLVAAHLGHGFELQPADPELHGLAGFDGKRFRERELRPLLRVDFLLGASGSTQRKDQKKQTDQVHANSSWIGLPWSRISTGRPSGVWR